jgi:hypothetical protein
LIPFYPDHPLLDTLIVKIHLNPKGRLPNLQTSPVECKQHFRIIFIKQINLFHIMLQSPKVLQLVQSLPLLQDSISNDVNILNLEHDCACKKVEADEVFLSVEDDLS